MQTKTKRKPWIRPRHNLIIRLAALVVYPWTKWKYHIKIEKCPELKKRQCLIVMNHQTAFDQFFVGMAFPRVIYYLATEDIFSLGFVSSLLRYLVAPIPIKKQTTDLAAIKTCLRVAREGGSIAIAPEGNRTYSGRTEYMSPAIAPLVRRMKLPIALYRIEGGYGKEPRWSDVVRKGKMRSYVARVIEPEEYASLSDDELFALIVRITRLYAQNYDWEPRISEDEMVAFLKICLSRAGANSMITPREMLRDYMTVLNILMQNPTVSFYDVVGTAVTLKTPDELSEEAEGAAGDDRSGTPVTPQEGGSSNGDGRRLYTPDDIDF